MKWKMQPLGLTLAMTLTLNFQGQILKQPYLRNRRANRHWTQGGYSWPWLKMITKMRCSDRASDVGVHLIRPVCLGIGKRQ